MSTSLLRRLIAAGTPDDLVDEVAELLAAARAIEKRRESDRSRKQNQRQREAKPCHVTSRETRDVTDIRDDVPPNEYILTPLEPRSSNDDRTPLAKMVISAWNEGPAKRGAVASRGLTPKRKAALRARVKEHSVDAVFEAIRNLAASDFHCGSNDRGWKADIGWLITSPENFQRMLELGNGSGRTSQVSFANDDEQARWFERSAQQAAARGDEDGAEHFRRQASKIREGPTAAAQIH